MHKVILGIIGILISFSSVADTSNGVYFGISDGSGEYDMRSFLIGIEKELDISSNDYLGFQVTTFHVSSRDSTESNYPLKDITSSDIKTSDKLFHGIPLGIMGTYRNGIVIGGLGFMLIREANIYIREGETPPEEGKRFYDRKQRKIKLDASIGLRQELNDNVSVGCEYSLLRGIGLNIGYVF